MLFHKQRHKHLTARLDIYCAQKECSQYDVAYPTAMTNYHLNLTPIKLIATKHSKVASC